MEGKRAGQGSGGARSVKHAVDAGASERKRKGKEQAEVREDDLEELEEESEFLVPLAPPHPSFVTLPAA